MLFLAWRGTIEMLLSHSNVADKWSEFSSVCLFWVLPYNQIKYHFSFALSWWPGNSCRGWQRLPYRVYGKPHRSFWARILSGFCCFPYLLWTPPLSYNYKYKYILIFSKKNSGRNYGNSSKLWNNSFKDVLKDFIIKYFIHQLIRKIHSCCLTKH